MRHSRQRRLTQLGEAAQARISGARVLIVGAGGLGSTVIPQLAAAGVGQLTICDDDRVELSNLNRQTIHRAADVGRRKTERAAEWVGELDPAIEVHTVTDRVSVHNARALAREADVVVDCVDGFPTKLLLGDAAVREQVPFVHGSITAFAGQVLAVAAGGQPCLRCMVPEVPPPSVVPTCREAGVLGASCAVVGSIMASVVLRIVGGFGPDPFASWTVVDVLPGNGAPLEVRSLSLPARAACAACSDSWELDAQNPDDYRLES